jgi:hypothetical protein
MMLPTIKVIKYLFLYVIAFKVYLKNYEKVRNLP